MTKDPSNREQPMQSPAVETSDATIAGAGDSRAADTTQPGGTNTTTKANKVRTNTVEADYASAFSPIREVLDELRAGNMIILTDDESRENEGDLVLPAEHATPELINFMLREAKGYLCLSLTEADCDRLRLGPQSDVNTSARSTPFTVSIDGHPKHGFTTGVSATERARCIRMAIDQKMGPEDFVRPGHINPLRSRDGGVLVRTGQTEGSVDLCRLADLYPAAIIIEITKDDGEMARVPDLARFAQEHNLKMCSVNQLIKYRLEQTTLVHRMQPLEGVPVRTIHGEFRCFSFRSAVDSAAHLAMVAGDIGQFDEFGRLKPSNDPILVRVQRHDLFGDVFGAISDKDQHVSARTVDAALNIIEREGRGVFLYMRPEGVGDDIDLRRRFLGPNAQVHEPMGAKRATHRSIDGEAMPMGQRDYGIGGQILRALGVTKMRLITDTPKELPGLKAFGLEIVEHVPVSSP